MLRAWLEVPALGELARLAQLVGLARLKKLFSTTRCTVNFYCKKRRKTLVFVTLSPRRIDRHVTYSGNRSLTGQQALAGETGGDGAGPVSYTHLTLPTT